MWGELGPNIKFVAGRDGIFHVIFFVSLEKAWLHVEHMGAKLIIGSQLSCDAVKTGWVYPKLQDLKKGGVVT